jgi:hypothetical protein
MIIEPEMPAAAAESRNVVVARSKLTTMTNLVGIEISFSIGALSPKLEFSSLTGLLGLAQPDRGRMVPWFGAAQHHLFLNLQKHTPNSL